jgi:hypothetical protein
MVPAATSAAVRMRIVADGRCEGDLDAGTGEIDRSVEGVAAAGQREPAIGAALEFDHNLADADGAEALGIGLVHALFDLLLWKVWLPPATLAVE